MILDLAADCSNLRFFFFQKYFLTDSSVFSFFQFLGNFLHSFLIKMVPHPQLATQIFSLAELDLSIKHLPRTVVFEIPLFIAC